MDNDLLYNLIYHLLLLLTGGGIAFMLLRLHDRRASRALQGPGLGGSYEPQQVLCDQRAAMLRTVEQAFPEHTVLPRVPAILLVSPRGGEKLTQRREALRRQMLDYVVLDSGGKPLFAFNLNGAVKRPSGAHSGDDLFTTWALKQAGISIYRISGMRSKVSPQRLRVAVGWETGGGEDPPEYRTTPFRSPT